MSANTSTLPVYDAITPYAGVKVMPSPGPHNHLPATQARNARIASTDGVLRMVPICKPVGLGMMSTVNSARCLCQVHEFRKGCAPGTIRPGSRRRGHAHRPANMAFSGKRITVRVERDRDAADMLKKLARFHLKVLTQVGNTTCLQSIYEQARHIALRDYPEIANKLAMIEKAHESSVR